MACTTRVRRALNREPVSLAATTAVLGVVDAVDTIEPSTPPLALNNYPPFDTEFDKGYIYPSLQPSPSLPLIQSQELTWSPSLDLQLPLLLPLPPPLIFDNKIASQGPFRWTLGIETLLFNTLLEQVNIEKRAESGFKKEAWIACCQAIQAVTTQLITVEKYKGKAGTMKAL
jgi:hypothetical protein